MNCSIKHRVALIAIAFTLALCGWTAPAIGGASPPPAKVEPLAESPGAALPHGAMPDLPAAVASVAEPGHEREPIHLLVEPAGPVARTAVAVRAFLELITAIVAILGIYALLLLGLVGLGSVTLARGSGRDSLEGLMERIDRRPVATLVAGLVATVLVGAMAKILAMMNLVLIGLLLIAAAVLAAVSGALARSWTLGSEKFLGGAPCAPLPRLASGSALFLAACLLPIAGQVFLVGTCLQGLGAWTLREAARLSAGHAPAPVDPPSPTPPSPPPAAS